MDREKPTRAAGVNVVMPPTVRDKGGAGRSSSSSTRLKTTLRGAVADW
jgi:hypothetical protein